MLPARRLRRWCSHHSVTADNPYIVIVESSRWSNLICLNDYVGRAQIRTCTYPCGRVVLSQKCELRELIVTR